MNLRHLSAIVAVVVFGGCASQPLPTEVAAVALVLVPSAAVAIYRPRLISTPAGLVLHGSVYRQYGVRSTERSHLEVTFLSGDGRVLDSETVAFSLGDLRGGSSRTMPPKGRYRVSIPALPAGTATIEVRAHDGPHSR